MTTAVDPASLADSPLLAAIAWTYLVINSTRIVTYVPQIVAVWRCTDGARAISLFTWTTWAISHLSGVLYGTLVLHDPFFVIITAINLMGCSSITTIVAMHRWRLRHPQHTHANGAASASSGEGVHRAAPRPVLGWAGMASLLAAGCVGVLVAALWLPARWQTPTAIATSIPPPAVTLVPLDELRINASVGQPFAAADLVAALLTRYETNDDKDALFEAMLVLDREWDQPQVLASGVIDRVVRKHCPAERLLRHLWICATGE